MKIQYSSLQIKELAEPKPRAQDSVLQSSHSQE